ncbi:energy-coupling factor ABC transporter ATP-binding protein [Desulfonatronum parangueonense]
MSDAPLLALQDAEVQYPRSTHPVLKDFDFSLLPGERIGLMGPNGSGKTTLLLSLVGLVPLNKGSLLFQGRPVRTPKDLARLRRLVGLVFQNPDDQLFSPTVLEDVAFGPLNLGLSQSEAQDASLAMLDRLHLAHLAHHQPHTLSGGQKRLVCLATVLVMRPLALLLDEPTNDLDPDSRQLLFQALQATPCAMVIASHDQQLLSALTDRVVAI